jgi:hypothetical protein
MKEKKFAVAACGSQGPFLLIDNIRVSVSLLTFLLGAEYERRDRSSQASIPYS